jgi:ABC-type Fe3+-hydroxamate transport system substrate-binding protein
LFISSLAQTPSRIISLVPSITELLFSLGLEDETIAITKFCVHPTHWHKNKTRIGGTKNVQIDTIKKLQPDLIICSKEENIQEQVEELATLFPVLLTDVKNYNDALEMISTIGKICYKENEALHITTNIKNNFSNLAITNTIPAAYLIWHKPYMTIGNDTFIQDMMTKAGFENIFADKTRYPMIMVEDIAERNPAVILLSSEPYPFGNKHIAELQAYLPHTKIMLADGEFFSWYGSRMQDAPAYFKSLFQSI